MKNEVAAESDPQQLSVEAILKSIVIPSCPAVLNELRSEIAREDPSQDKVARLVGTDVALSVAVLRLVNSPFYALRSKVDSISKAVSMIGSQRMAMLVTNILMRQTMQFKGLNLVRFWDVSTKRSIAMSLLARNLKGVDVDTAQAFGLFCDIGIPLLMQRFPSYLESLSLANAATVLPFTSIESERHGVDHAQMGSMMARTWGLNDTICVAIRRHHDYAVFPDASVAEPVKRLIAMCLVAELGIQRFARLNESNEWNKGGDFAASTLMLSDYDLDDWIEMMAEAFGQETA